MASRLPAFALFPISTWRDQLPPDEWAACLGAWQALLDSHLSLSDSEFATVSSKDDSLPGFLTSFTREVALGGIAILGPSQAAKKLLKTTFELTTRLLQSPSVPSELLQWEFAADLSRLYGHNKVWPLLDSLPASSKTGLDSSLAGLKKFLIKNLDAGLDGGDLKGIEERLERVNDLIRVSPPIAEFFLAGSDFVDGLISCYKITNPPLRRVLIATTYLCLTGLAEGQKLSSLTDQLYSLKAAAETHRTGPLNVNDSLVAELVTSTPLLQKLQRRLEQTPSTSTRAKAVFTELGTFKKAGSGITKPKRLIKRKVDKGKGLAELDDAQVQQEIHIHRMSQISQVQDLFPDLGTGFIAKLLDEYSDSPEVVISHLLDDSLPPHLQTANRTEDLSPSQPAPQPRRSSLIPRPTPPLHPSTNPTEDDSDDAILNAPLGSLHIGKRPGNADTLLAAPKPASHKAAVLSALAAFDSDDDERDDTYDAADVGGTVPAGPGADDDVGSGTATAGGLSDAVEGILFRTWLAATDPGKRVFARENEVLRLRDRLLIRTLRGGGRRRIKGAGRIITDGTRGRGKWLVVGLLGDLYETMGDLVMCV
ncbi:hypothetical protein B0J18DRAFT_296517 [Chaetomium sp. MPI-SDFR-AT-0129]|nr:hypothetical protein B0J18DRAFT_296517 [Chaetomium sp. MPI-SDFR-AT-0129]